MMLSEREQRLLAMLADDPSLSVTAMSAALGVSGVTIRSDLQSLEEKGLILRTRGGAMPAFHPAVVERMRQQTTAKERIAKAAAALVADGDTIMISAGTTTSPMVRHLLGRRRVHVVTNSTLVFPYARTNPGLRLTVVSGEFNAASEALLGLNTLRDLDQYHVKLAFVGTDGFSAARGITADQVEVAGVVRKMAAQASECILMADSSKYGRAGFAHIDDIRMISCLVTDSGLSETAQNELKKKKIKVILA